VANQTSGVLMVMQAYQTSVVTWSYRPHQASLSAALSYLKCGEMCSVPGISGVMCLNHFIIISLLARDIGKASLNSIISYYDISCKTYFFP